MERITPDQESQMSAGFTIDTWKDPKKDNPVEPGEAIVPLTSDPIEPANLTDLMEIDPLSVEQSTSVGVTYSTKRESHLTSKGLQVKKRRKNAKSPKIESTSSTDIKQEVSQNT